MIQKITIFSKTNCGYCIAAIDECRRYGLPYDVKHVDKDESAMAKLKKLKPNAKTVPQIWLGNKYVGGYNDLVFYIENFVAPLRPEK